MGNIVIVKKDSGGNVKETVTMVRKDLPEGGAEIVEEKTLSE